jgi:hypothetical protein
VKKTINTLRLIKDNLGLRTSGMYCIPCECGKVYVGHTSRKIEVRCQERIRHPWPIRKICCSRTYTKHRI